jgi:hypothetical protein
MARQQSLEKAPRDAEAVLRAEADRLDDRYGPHPDQWVNALRTLVTEYKPKLMSKPAKLGSALRRDPLSLLISFRAEALQMARQRSLEESPSGGEAVLRAEAGRLADRYGVDPDRVVNALRTSVAAFAPELMQKPAEFGSALRRFPLSLLADAIQAVSPEEALALLEAVGPVVLARRVSVAEYLCRDSAPLYSRTELADRTQAFVQFMLDHRDYLVRTGLPPRRFPSCPWLYRHLGRLYDTRATGSPWPREEIFDPAGKAAGEPYRWRGPSAVVYRPEEIQYVRYEDADLLRGLRPQDAARVEGMRGKLFDLKVAVLQQLTDALRQGDAAGMWERCVGLLTRDLSAEDATFLLDLDRWYMGVDAREGWAEGAPPKMIPGGLTNLLEVIGHCEQELRVGTFARARAALAGLVDVDRPGLLGVGDHHPGHPYFKFVGRPERARLDAALDGLLGLEAAGRELWEEYRRRANAALQQELRASAGVILRPEFIPDLRRLLQLYADPCEASLKARRPLPPPVAERPAAAPQPAENVFRKEGDDWMVCYQGVSLLLPDSPGAFYIARMLRLPSKKISASELWRAHAGYAAGAGGGVCKRAGAADAGEGGFSALGSGDAGAVLGEEGKEDCEKECQRLQEELSRAQRNNDLAEIDRLSKDIRELDERVRRAKNPDGSDRNVDDSSEKARKAVSAAIQRTIEKIERKPNGAQLARHFLNSLRLGMSCSYTPETPTHWVA